MLTFANKQYAKNDKEMVESLFTSGGTCAGFYKKRKNGWLLLNLQKEPFAFIVAHPNQGYFAVNASNDHHGKTHYFLSTCSITEKTLGIDALTSSQQRTACKEAKEI